MGSDFFQDITNEYKPYQEIKRALEYKETPVSIYGLASQGISFILSNLQKQTKKPFVFFTYDPVRGRKIYEDFLFYKDKGVYYLDPRELFFFDRAAGSKEIIRNRLEVIQALLEGKVEVLITSLATLGENFQEAESFRENIFSLKLGQTFSLEQVKEKLHKLGYERVDIVEAMGQYSIRGSIVDLYGAGPFPYRVEFFDIEVDSIRSFDPLSQRSLDSYEEISIFPVEEFLLDQETKKQVGKALEKDLKGLKNLDELARNKSLEKFLPLKEKLDMNEKISNMDLIIPYLPKEYKNTIFSYFSAQPIVILDEPRKLEERATNDYLDFQETISDLLEIGEVFGGHKNIQEDYYNLIDKVKDHPLLILNSIVRKDQYFAPKRVANFDTKTVTSFNGRIRAFQEELERYSKKNYRIVLLGGNEEKTQRLLQTIGEMGLSVSLLSTGSKLRAGQIYVGEGNVHGGFEIEEISFVLLNSTEIYGSSKTKKKKKKKDIIDINHLHYGDYVVHESHGIGQFMGTSQLDVQGTKRDYLTIQYKGGDKIFLPMDQLSIIHKYTSSKDQPPKINPLNSVTWQKTKARAKKSVEEMADDLIALYAKRESEKGHDFGPDTPWQKEFEDAFEYEETQGQLECIEEIKGDMEEAKPMDRLLCADVGYGKTEVALRAAFKAIMDGKQVAFLVPTTILAQQHYNTIMERFSGFPIRVGLLSRFRSAKQIREDLRDLARGSVDLVLGTHRLLSKDVVFKDLGLLIIDEEQRFGVRHKEKLKLLKENIDTLTLTATPIPRTLQMSMAGIRDMSLIEEPPEERFPIQTYVVEYNDVMVRNAILKEIERGGQVFFVYNRVQNMENMLYDLRRLVPEASFAMANGQMPEHILEDTMLSFVERQVDVLLCSTIIETGMDVSNANTIIIYESNRLGLSQLYQLRGRVGRSSRIAYAYFTYKKDASISELAEKRLRAISEFTEFGSGYKIALRDLEIRGSGNILGESQHGHMDAIGYDFYIKMLKTAVGKRKGEIEEDRVETSLDIYIDAFLPKAYIRDESQRMEMYRKIALIEDDRDEQDVMDELIDRFGDPSRAVENLIRLSKIRHKASKLSIASISQKDEDFFIDFAPEFKVELSLINELNMVFGKKIVFSLGDLNQFQFKNLGKTPLNELEKFIHLLEDSKKRIKS